MINYLTLFFYQQRQPRYSIIRALVYKSTYHFHFRIKAGFDNGPKKQQPTGVAEWA